MTAALLTAAQVGDLLDVGTPTIYRMAGDGRLPALRVGRQWRFPAGQVARSPEVGVPATAAAPTAPTNGIPATPPADDLLGTLVGLVAESLGVMMVVTDMGDGRGALPPPPARGFVAHGDDEVVARCTDGWRAMAGGIAPDGTAADSDGFFHLDDLAKAHVLQLAPRAAAALCPLIRKGAAMKRLLVLGAGTAGTMVVNKLRPRLPADEWQITIVDPATGHHYQPGYLLVPFGTYDPAELVKPTARFIPEGVELVRSEVDRIVPDQDHVLLADGTRVDYDQLVVATGTTPRPDQAPGMDGAEWRRSIFDFYTLEGATALRDALAAFDGGRLVIHITEMPIKCPVAPLEFAFLADAWFRDRGMRDRVEMVYVTPLDGAFTKPVASRHLGGMLDERKIALEPDFLLESIDDERKVLVSYDEREIPFDLLVTVPLNMGADMIARSGMGDELNYVPVDEGTLQSTSYDNVFAVGDASDIRASKAGSVAHFSIDLFTENFVDHVHGRPMTRAFDGHANCFVESGGGKALLIDFNYDTQPLPGTYPLPGIGPFHLLRETEVNHWGKLLFRWTYWNVLLPGRELPLPALMSMAGKEPEEVSS